MKEKSVEFYKKFILRTATIMVVTLVLIICILVIKNLNIFGSDEVDAPGEVQLPEHNIGEFLQEPSLNIPLDEEEEEGIVQTDVVISEKMVYLTFDDGATHNTEEILDILKAKKVPATFFFMTIEGKTSDAIIKRAYDEGHAVGVLTSSKKSYAEIFTSAERYKEDLDASYNKIKTVTGKAPEVLRFPGGSRSSFTKGIYNDLIKIVQDKGLVYFDWTVCADSGSTSMSKDKIIAKGTKLSERSNVVIVLLHDNGNHNMCDALGEIIDFYKVQGYAFGKLTSSVEPITF